MPFFFPPMFLYTKVSWLEKLWKIPDCVRGWGNEVKEHVSRSLPFQGGVIKFDQLVQS